MKYYSKQIEIAVPIHFLFDYITQHENFDAFRIQVDDYEINYVNRENESSGKVVEGYVYKLKMESSGVECFMDAKAVKVERPKIIKYQYLITEIKHVVDEYFDNRKGLSKLELKALNKNPDETSYKLKAVDKNSTQLTLEFHKAGKMNIVYQWFQKLIYRFNPDFKHNLLILEKIKSTAEAALNQTKF